MVDFTNIIDKMIMPKVTKQRLKDAINANYNSNNSHPLSKDHNMIVLLAACDGVMDRYSKSVIKEKHEVNYEVIADEIVMFRYHTWTIKFNVDTIGEMIEARVKKNEDVSGEEIEESIEEFVYGVVNRWFDNKYKLKRELDKRGKVSKDEIIEGVIEEVKRGNVKGIDWES